MTSHTAALSHRLIEPMSERLANAIRAQAFEKMEDVSPYAACMMPLLTALGWCAYQRELVEALPHFADELDLVDLRNVLVTLGYESDEKRVRLDQINPDLLPSLFLSDGGEIYVITDRVGSEITYFDAHSRAYVTTPVRRETGRAYMFTDIHPTRAMSDSGEADEGWFMQLLVRFRKVVKHLLAMTFVLNVVALLVPLFIMVVYDNVIGARSLQTLPYLIGGLTVALACEFGLRLIRARTIGLIAGRLDYIIGVETFKKLLYLPPQMTERSTVTSQLSRLKQFESIRDFFTGSNATLMVDLPFVVLFLVVLAILGGVVAIVPLAMIFIYAAFAVVWLPSLNKRLTHAGKTRSARQRMLMETFSGLRELKALGAEGTWRELFRELSGEAMSAVYRTSTHHAVVNSIAQSLATIAGICVLGLGTWQVMHGDMSIGALIAVMALLWRVLSPLQGVCVALLQIDQVVQSIKQLNQLMRLKTESSSNKSALLMPEVQGRISFSGVGFRYGPSQDPVLRGASFEVEPGEFVAVIGGNGSGKSTVLKLIAGMYRAQAGVLAVDQIDVRQTNAIDLRRVIAYVPQKPSLFRGTIAQNLRLNNPLATHDEIWRAAEKAGVLEGISELPHGFNTIVGDHTTDQLPSGLIHGICLARAYVRQAAILLLDEPGSSLDSVSDENLIEQLNSMRGQKTIVMVSHRPAHIRLADKVIVMAEGAVAYVGPPAEALKFLEESQKC